MGGLVRLIGHCDVDRRAAPTADADLFRHLHRATRRAAAAPDPPGGQRLSRRLPLAEPRPRRGDRRPSLPPHRCPADEGPLARSGPHRCRSDASALHPRSGPLRGRSREEHARSSRVRARRRPPLRLFVSLEVPRTRDQRNAAQDEGQERGHAHRARERPLEYEHEHEPHRPTGHRGHRQTAHERTRSSSGSELWSSRPCKTSEYRSHSEGTSSTRPPAIATSSALRVASPAAA